MNNINHDGYVHPTHKSMILEELGLDTYKIQTTDDLNNALDSGLTKLYQSVFADPPYNESFETSEVEEIFTSYLENGGHIFVATNEGGKPVAFVSSVPLKADFDVVNATKNYVQPNNTAYFAEDGVVKNLRQHGISAAMKDMLLSSCSAEGLETLLLRTSIYNYKQISAVNKAGGNVITNLFQRVTSTRSDGTMTQDTRSFYTFDLEGTDPATVTTLEHVTIVRPGGNDTAVVWDKISRDKQGAVSLKIQDTYPGIEQVMFVEDGKNGLKRGQMAGGEFCGNATRSLGCLLLDGKDGNITIETSGTNEPMTVIVKDGMAQTSLPVKEELSSAQADGENYIVHLDGISFVITKSSTQLGQKITNGVDEDTKKATVMDVLNKNGFANEFSASGVLVADKQDDGTYKLEPFVYVRDTGTLYYETGCGSGSTSVGVMIAKETGQSIKNLKIKQPSGMDLMVSIDRDESKFIGAKVNGPIEILFDGRMYIAEPKSENTLNANLAL